MFRRSLRPLLFRVLLTAAAVAFWFWTQHLIGARPLPASGIGDGVHDATAAVNLYLLSHPSLTNLLLILSSAIIDLLALLIIGRWVCRGDGGPFMALVIVLLGRQVMQACVSLPAPRGMIWHYPGFPSLFVTYGVSNDFFFSGHTAIAVVGASVIARGMIARAGKRWLTAMAALIVLFEIATVLALRAHYTMDVFAGLVAGLYAVALADRLVQRREPVGFTEN